MNDIQRYVTNKKRGRAVVHQGVVYVGGMTATDRSLDIRGQTSEALQKLDDVLAQAGTDKSRILTAQIWLKDISSDFAGMNEIWDAWLLPDAWPTRAACQAEMAAPDVLVEIIVSAAAAVD